MDLNAKNNSKHSHKKHFMRLHTLMFGWEYPPFHSGGLGVACQGLVRGLLKNKLRVTLVLPNGSAEGEEHLDIVSPSEKHLEALKIMNVHSMLQPYDSFTTYDERWKHLASTTPNDAKELYGPDLGDAVERYTALAVTMTEHAKPDVIHVHDWMTYEAGVHAARHHRVPLVAHIHATEFDRTDNHPNEWIAARERRGLLLADKVIAVSGYTKEMLMRHYGIPGDKITVVHNGHDQHHHHIKPALASRYGLTKEPMVLFLGRMTVQKNPWQFLEVASRVHTLRPEVQFVMAGEGPMLSSLVDHACELGLQDNVIFTGKVNRHEVQSLYQRADCFVMPSLSEPFGLVALEAIAHRTPVILSKQSGVAEVVEHAFKVDFWDTDKMSDCILTILREQPLAEQLMSEAPRVLQRLSWKNQAGRVRSLYEQVMNDYSRF